MKPVSKMPTFTFEKRFGNLNCIQNLRAHPAPIRFVKREKKLQNSAQTPIQDAAPPPQQTTQPIFSHGKPPSIPPYLPPPPFQGRLSGPV